LSTSKEIIITTLTSFHVLIEHDPTHIFYIVEFLALKKLADIHDIFFFDPNEKNTILHDTFGDEKL